MNVFIRNILAVVVGWLVGGFINMMLIKLGMEINPIPGFDMNDQEQWKTVYLDLDFKYYVFPFAAHALGTFVGALLGYLIAYNHKLNWAMGIGLLFFIGGIIACFTIKAPFWFVLVDLIFAYLPMAWLAAVIGEKIVCKQK